MRLGDSVQSKLLGLLKNPHVMKGQRGCRVPEDRVKEMVEGRDQMQPHGMTSGWRKHLALAGVGDH